MASRHGRHGPDPHLGRGRSITGMCLDPNDSHVMYVSVDLGPKVGVWRIVTRTRRSAPSPGSRAPRWTTPGRVRGQGGQSDPCLCRYRQGHSGRVATRGVAYHPPGAWTSGWRDITGNLVADESIADVRPTGIDVGQWRRHDEPRRLPRLRQQPGRQRIADLVVLRVVGCGRPSWKRPADATVKYNLGGDGGCGGSGRSSRASCRTNRDSTRVRASSTAIRSFRGPLWIARYRRGPNQLEVVNEGLQVTYAWDVVCSRTNALQGVHDDTDWGAAALEGRPVVAADHGHVGL